MVQLACVHLPPATAVQQVVFTAFSTQQESQQPVTDNVTG